jgi:RNA polymerase sigma factor (sigma-70 family)
VRLTPDDSVVAALVVRAQLGDLGALDRLLRVVQAPLYAHIAYVTRDPDAARDVLQNVLLTISRALGQLDDPRLLRAWAFRIATRAAVRHSKRRRETETLDDLPEMPAEIRAAQADDIDAIELTSTLTAAIEELPPACGIAVRLRYFEELSLVEIAEALDVPVGTVKSRLSYGVALLRQRFGVTTRT